jgi:hypothetical protein
VVPSVDRCKLLSYAEKQEKVTYVIPGVLGMKRVLGTKRFVALVAVVAALVATSVAMAGSSTVLGSYGSNSAKPVIKVKSATAVSTAKPVQTAATLPFTGADLVVVSIAGVALLGLGFGLRRLGRDRA